MPSAAPATAAPTSEDALPSATQRAMTIAAIGSRLRVVPHRGAHPAGRDEFGDSQRGERDRDEVLQRRQESYENRSST